MSNPALWRITCLEDDYPGLWQLWFKKQCVTDGHSPYEGWEMVGGKKRDRDWIATRNALDEIQPGHLIVVALPDCRVGRIGKVVGKKVSDKEWKPLFPGDDDWKDGYMGRRILVRWELDRAPRQRGLGGTTPREPCHAWNSEARSQPPGRVVSERHR